MITLPMVLKVLHRYAYNCNWAQIANMLHIDPNRIFNFTSGSRHWPTNWSAVNNNPRERAEEPELPPCISEEDLDLKGTFAEQLIWAFKALYLSLIHI